MAEPRLTVIIPTYNRAPVLDLTLRALCEEQAGELPEWELIVVNDGSTDGTAALLRDMEKRCAGWLYAVEQPNMKQGAARNNAMSRARGELFVFLGDDIIPSPGFLAHHWNGYLAAREPAVYAAIGCTAWHPAIKVTPFRDWINEWGMQFGFKLIADPEQVPFNFFYTSNLAVSRRLYDTLGGFDARFREYGWEDIELGYRYERRGGMVLRYIPEALAFHHHHLSVRSFCRRQFKVGYSAVLFHELCPELADFLHLVAVPRYAVALRPLLGIAARLLEIGDERLGLELNRYADKLLRGYYLLGMLRGQQERQAASAKG